MKTTKYIHLQDDETFASAACGCNIDGQAFYQCPLHQNAAKLLEVVRICYEDACIEGEEKIAKFLKKAIKSAEGK